MRTTNQGARSLNPVPNDEQRGDDYRLVQQTLGGDEEACERFSERMRCIHPFLVTIDRRATGSLGPDGLGDARQEAMMRIWRDRPKFSGRSSLETWMYQYAEFVHREMMRKRATAAYRLAGSDLIEDLAAADSDPSTDLLAGLEDEALRFALTELTPDEHELIWMKDYEGHSFSAIAQLLVVNINTIKARYYKAIKALRSHFRKFRPGDQNESTAFPGDS